MLKKATSRPTAVSRFLALFVTCSLLVISANACADTPPNADLTCAQQKDLGKCERPWMIDGNFCQKTCGRCSPPAPIARASPPAPAVSTAAAPVETKPPAVEITPVLTILPVAEEPATEQALAPVPPPAPQTEPTPAQEQYLAELDNEAAVLTQSNPTQGGTGVQKLPALTLPTDTAATSTGPTAVDGNQPSPPQIIRPPAQKPAMGQQSNSVQVPAPKALKPGCNTISAWDALSSDPQLSITLRAAEVMNLKGALQNPNINFTLFAPTNEAWNRAAQAEQQPLNQLLASKNVLRDILFSHIIPNEVLDAATLSKFRSITPQTNVPIYIVSTNGSSNIGLVSSGSNVRVIQGNEAMGCNYAIHKIDGVLRSSPSDILGVNPTYTRAAAAAAASAAGGVPAGAGALVGPGVVAGQGK